MGGGGGTWKRAGNYKSRPSLVKGEKKKRVGDCTESAQNGGNKGMKEERDEGKSKENGKEVFVTTWMSGVTDCLDSGEGRQKKREIPEQWASVRELGITEGELERREGERERGWRAEGQRGQREKKRNRGAVSTMHNALRGCSTCNHICITHPHLYSLSRTEWNTAARWLQWTNSTPVSRPGRGWRTCSWRIQHSCSPWGHKETERSELTSLPLSMNLSVWTLKRKKDALCDSGGSTDHQKNTL